MTNKTLSITLVFFIGISSLRADDLEPIISSASCIDIAKKEKLRKSEIIRSNENTVWASRKDKYLLMYSCKNNHIDTYSSAFFDKEKYAAFEVYKKYVSIFTKKYGEPAPITMNSFKLEDLIFWETDMGIVKMTFRRDGPDKWITGYTVYLK